MKSREVVIIALAKRHYLKPFAHFTRKGERLYRLCSLDAMHFTIHQRRMLLGQSQQIVIQFPPDFLGEHFFENPAFRGIGDLLKKSYRGLLFHLSDLKEIPGRIKAVLQMNDFERTIELLNILHTLAQQKQFIELSSIGYSTQLNKTESARLNAIYAFILEHFKSNLDLNKVAQFAHMTPQAFSRYFKERTRRTFVSFLNEVRIGYACRLLTESDLGISRICYESGYSNLSNFNRQFKRTIVF